MLEEVEFGGLRDSLRTTVDVELAVNVARMHFHGAHRKHQPPGNLAVGKFRGKQAQHIQLTLRSAVRAGLICCQSEWGVLGAEERADRGFQVLAAPAFPGGLIGLLAKLAAQVGAQTGEQRPVMQPAARPGGLLKRQAQEFGRFFQQALMGTRRRFYRQADGCWSGSSRRSQNNAA